MQRVIPYVEDHRNCLLVEPHEPLTVEVMASLQAALKGAIQVEFQLEDVELAAEPLPTGDDRRMILLYESAEGGAGVLRQLLDDPQALPRVARRALEICHYDPDTLADLRHAPGRREDCEAACYDCLMSYYNQPDHALLDRTLLRDLLKELSTAEVRASPAAVPRSEHLTHLKMLCESDLERQWLDFLEQHALRLPDSAQHLIESCSTRPDFLYASQHVAIYVDGPAHDQPDVAAEDARIVEALEDIGYTVVRFGYRAVWSTVCAEHGYLFGEPADGAAPGAAAE
jgi:very-short-patch-repair endonuclease